ncbi:MAG: phosphomannomutase/phosphoglucomutase [Planctomycetota bacterium]|nr:phosphomannomutase/phosphoglucomutase [Planctomycetota bacterium]
MAGFFKSYDVRGIVPDQLTTGDAYRIGKATAAYLKARTLAVGRDARLSSPDLAAALMAGIAAAGCDALDLGMGPTPITYFAAGHLGKAKCGGAIQVTASHNPAEYGGFKFTKAGALPMSYDQGLDEVEKLFAKDLPPLAKKPGAIRKLNLWPKYVAHCRRFAALDKKRKLKLAIDCGNGVMGAILPALLKGLPLTAKQLYWKPDGRFPNHEANPLKLENLADLRAAVVKGKCDLGVAFDGDGDRVAFVDEKGEPVPGDLAGALMAQSLLKQTGAGTVLYDVRASRAFAKAVEEAGGTALETRVGHSHIKAGLREHKALMAAELSGHYYFRDFFYSDSGETAFFLVLALLSQSGKPASELVAPLQRFHHTGEINFHVRDADRTLAAVETHFKDRVKTRSTTDGLSMDLGPWWFNLRKSNTEPVVRLNLESLNSRAEMEAARGEVVGIIEKS